MEFYVNKTATTATPHLVHKTGCSQMPENSGLLYIGSYASADAAVKIATGYFSPVDCCPACLKAG